MAGSITRAACPECKKVGGLTIETRFVAKPLGTWSLSGTQLKAPAELLPVLECSNCPLKLVGEFDGDSHATFRPPVKVSS